MADMKSTALLAAVAAGTAVLAARDLLQKQHSL